MDMRDVTLAVLAGGEGRRMGMPKSRLTVGDKPILTHLLDRLFWRGPTMLVTAPGNTNPPGCERFDRETTDAVAGEGPLRGVWTALDAAGTECLVVVPVDMPGVTREPLEWMAMRVVGFAALMLRTDRVQPLPIVFTVATARIIVKQQMDRREMSLHALAEHRQVVVEPAPDGWGSEFWTNWNVPQYVPTKAGVPASSSQASRGGRS